MSCRVALREEREQEEMCNLVYSTVNNFECKAHCVCMYTCIYTFQAPMFIHSYGVNQFAGILYQYMPHLFMQCTFSDRTHTGIQYTVQLVQ